jgi:pimeloyl-ACP methyl ester carboxylesterase
MCCACLAILLPSAACTRPPAPESPLHAAAATPLVRAGEADVPHQLRHVPQARASWFQPQHGGPRLYVFTCGSSTSAPPLVLFHGIGEGGMRDFYPVFGTMCSARRVISIDLPGFGKSDRNDADLTPERLTRTIASVVHAFGLKRVDMLGHSSGAALALLFAAQEPRLVRRLILLAVVGILRPETLLRSQLHEHLGDMRENAPGAARAIEKTGDAFVNAVAALVPSAGTLQDTGVLGQSPSVKLATSLFDYNFGSAIAGVRAPTLMVWGDRDETAPVRVAELLLDRLPDSELIFVHDAAHVPMKDQPSALITAIHAYLDGVLPPSPRRELASTTGAHCMHLENALLTGSYDEVVVDHCKHARLEHLHARHIVIKESDVRLDHVEVAEGVRAENSNLVITGGSLHGEIALDLDGGEHDLAGVIVQGTRAAVRAVSKSTVLFSVTELISPKNDRFAHERRDLNAGTEL